MGFRHELAVCLLWELDSPGGGVVPLVRQGVGWFLGKGAGGAFRLFLGLRLDVLGCSEQVVQAYSPGAVGHQHQADDGHHGVVLPAGVVDVEGVRPEGEDDSDVQDHQAEADHGGGQPEDQEDAADHLETDQQPHHESRVRDARVLQDVGLRGDALVLPAVPAVGDHDDAHDDAGEHQGDVLEHSDEGLHGSPCGWSSSQSYDTNRPFGSGERW